MFTAELEWVPPGNPTPPPQGPLHPPGQIARRARLKQHRLALTLAGLEPRAPYNLRHTYAWHCLQAGVPIADLARQMGHADVSRTFTVYGGWCREMGENTAALRETWATAAMETAK